MKNVQRSNKAMWQTWIGLQKFTQHLHLSFRRYEAHAEIRLADASKATTMVNAKGKLIVMVDNRVS